MIHTINATRMAAAFAVMMGVAWPVHAQPIPTQGPAINPTFYKAAEGVKTVTVDCDDTKQSLAAALADKTPGQLNIVFSGTCKEYVAVPRDDVAIRGKDAAASIAGNIEINGYKRVLLENFTCRENSQSEYCIGALNGASVTFHNVKVFNSRVRGVLVMNATALIDGLSIDKTGSAAMLARGASIRMEGELTFANSSEGCLVIDSGTSVFSRIGTFTARDCGAGIIVQANSMLEAPFASFTVNHNSFVGLLVATHASFTYGGTIVAKNNTRAAILVDDNSSFSPLSNITSGAALTLENNGEAGIEITQGSLVELANVKANTGSSYGIRVDDSRLRIGRSTISGNSKADVRLQFGAHATFLEGATVGTLTCDGTELVRGNKTPCTPDAKPTTKTSTGPAKP
jgi:hypothetical protein